MITLTHVELIKYIMNNNPSKLEHVSAHFNKTSHHIRKEIQSINDFFNNESITIKNSVINTIINYDTFISIMKSLNFGNYLSSQEERINVIIVKSFFEDYCNLTQLYQEWNLSLTTKKRDMQKLQEYVDEYGLKIIKKPGSGIKITGDILHYRVILIRILIFCLDVSHFKIVRREVNTPIENYIYDIFMDNLGTHAQDAESLISNFLNEYQHDINYYSKKFFSSYVLLALHKSEFNKVIPNDLKLKPLNLYLFNDSFENRAFNQVASMIDFNPTVMMPHNQTLYNHIKNMYHTITQQLDLEIKTKEDAIQELYLYVYRQYFHEHFNYVYEDKLVKYIGRYFPDIVPILKDSLNDLEGYLDFKFHEEHLTSLTLIIAKWNLRNRFYGSNKKRIVLVTNVAFERVNYFIEALHEKIDFELVKTLDINEIDVLKDLDYDIVLSFSNRIYTVLKNSGFDSLKVNYFITNEDILQLHNLGFETPRTLIDTKHFLENLNTIPDHEKHQYLKNHYPTIFM